VGDALVLLEVQRGRKWVAAAADRAPFGEHGVGWPGDGRAAEGPPGCLHGGWVATAFDDLMGLAQMASGKAGFTGTLTVKMLKPTPLHQRIDYEASLDHVDGRKIWCKASARHGDELLGEAEIVFISPRGVPFWEE